MNPLNFEFKDGYLVESLEQPIINQALEIIIGGNSTNLGRHYQVVSTLNSVLVIRLNCSLMLFEDLKSEINWLLKTRAEIDPAY